MTRRRGIGYVRRDLLLLLALLIILCLVVSAYEDLPEIVWLLRAGKIDGAEALGRGLGAIARLGHDLAVGWRPIEKQMGKRIDQIQEHIVEPLARKVTALVR